MESALRCITHHLRVAAAKEFVPHMAEDLPVAPLSRQSLSRHALGEPVLSERPDVRRMLVLPAHVVDRMGCVPARYAHVAAAYEAMRIDYACFRALT